MEEHMFKLHTPSLLAKSMFYYIQAIGYLKHSLFCERENFDSFLLLYINKGRVCLKYRGQAYSLVKGQLFIINCMDYQYYISEEEPVEISFVHFNGSESKNYVEHILKSLGPVFTFNNESIILQYINQLLELFSVKDKQIDTKSSFLLVGILTELLLASSNTNEEPSIIPDIIVKAMKNMENHYKNPVDLHSVCKEIGISKTHLSKLFKKHTGYSPYEYLISYRLSQGKSLLKFTELTISEIAEKAGFENVSHFIKMFRQYEGITPLKFRKHFK